GRETGTIGACPHVERSKTSCERIPERSHHRNPLAPEKHALHRRTACGQTAENVAGDPRRPDRRRQRRNQFGLTCIFVDASSRSAWCPGVCRFSRERKKKTICELETIRPAAANTSNGGTGKGGATLEEEARLIRQVQRTGSRSAAETLIRTGALPQPDLGAFERPDRHF